MTDPGTGWRPIRLEVEVERGTICARVWPIQEEFSLDRGGVAPSDLVVIR